MKRFQYHPKKLKLVVVRDEKLVKEFNDKLSSMLNTESGSTTQEAYDKLETAFKDSASCFKSRPSQFSILRPTTKAEIIMRESLLRDRKKNDAAEEAFRKQRKKVSKMIQQDERDSNTRDVKLAIEKGKSLRLVKNGTFIRKSWIQKLRDKSGRECEDRSEILEIAAKFYEQLYSSTLTPEMQKKIAIDLSGDQEIEDICEEEVRFATHKMKNNKATGSDDFPIELIKICNGDGIHQVVEILNKILKSEDIPEQWLESEIILIFKSGDKSDIKKLSSDQSDLAPL